MTSTQTKLTFAKRILGALTTLVLVACGGGGGGAGSGGGFLPDNNGTPTPSYTLTVSGKNAGGTATNEFSASSPLTIEVLVEDTSTNTASVVSGAVVELQSTVGTITPANASALTNAAGIAEFTLGFNQEEGAGTVTASYVVDGTTYSGTFNVQSIIEPSNEPVITLSLAATNSTGDTVTTLSQRSPATLTASFLSTLDGVATPISGELVTINTNVGDVSPSNNTALTDANGDAVFTVSFNGTEGAGSVGVTASLDGVAYTDTLNLQAVATNMNYKLALYQSDGVTPLNGASFTADSPLSFVATLEDVSTGVAVPVKSELVLANATIGNLSQASALTDLAGEARFTLNAGGVIGAGVVSASFETPLGAVTTQANVAVTSNAAVSYTIDITNGSNGWVFSDANPLTLDVTVSASDASDLSGLLVTLTTDLGLVVGNGSAILQEVSGVYTARFTVNYANVVGAGTLTASFSSAQETYIDTQSVETIAAEAYRLTIIQDVTIVRPGSPMTLIVRLDDADGAPKSNQTVSLNNTIGALSRSSGVTDSAGETEFLLSYDGASGDGLVTANYTANGNTYTQSLRVVIAGAPYKLSDVTFLDFNSNPIADAIISSTDPYREITASVTLTDLGGNELENRLIQFVSAKGQLTPIDGYVLTDATGVAQVTIAYTDDITSGIGELSASYVSALGTVSSIADIQVVSPNLVIGSLEAPIFSEGLIRSTPANGSIVNQGSAVLEVDILDGAGLDIANADNTDLNTSEQIVAFNSTCLDDGSSTLSPANPIATSSGQISVTYTAGPGCIGEDEVIATLQFGASATAQIASQVLTIAAAVEAVSIEAVDTVPTTIAIAGTGAATNLPESSTVRFRVVDENGAPVANEQVDFSLSSSVGGVNLSALTLDSGADGLVTVTLNSGSLPVQAVVTAELNSTGQLVTSDIVSVSTGIPDQDSLTLFATQLAIPSAADVVNTETTVSVRLADRYNNVVPDGSFVYFTTEFGAIGNSCQITDGSCNVTWISQDPYPSDSNLFDLSDVDCDFYDIDDGAGGALDGNLLNDSDSVMDPCPGPFDPVFSGVRSALGYGLTDADDAVAVEQGSRSSILASTTGEESFTDEDGDGLYSDAAPADTLGDAVGEPFLDTNENGVRDAGEYFEDSGAAATSGVYDDGDALDGGVNIFTGIACAADAVDCTDTTLSIFDNLTLVLSPSSDYYIALVSEERNVIAAESDDGRLVTFTGTTITYAGDDSATITYTLDGPVRQSYQLVGQPGGTYAVGKRRLIQDGLDVVPGSYVAYISDRYNNQPAAGSTISVTAAGECSISSPATYTVPDGNAPYAYSAGIEIGAVTNVATTVDSVTISISNPGGTAVSQTFPCTPL